MDTCSLENERIVLENTLSNKDDSFEAKYMAVWSLQSLSEKHPDVISIDTISILEKVLIDSELSHQTQAYFMYKEVANTLCSIIIHSKILAGHAFDTLKGLLGTTHGHPHRAVAEALGALPLSIEGPGIFKKSNGHSSVVSWKQLCEKLGYGTLDTPQFIGRSLVTGLPQRNELLVIKLACKDESLESLVNEALWMEYLEVSSHNLPVRFNVPKAIKLNGYHGLRLSEIPVMVPRHLDLHQNGYAIGFVAHEEYYSYPNDIREDKHLNNAEFREVICRNAWLLGRLASQGIIHSAPVPLFHNRVQRQRRRDQGLYEWPRAGRIDRWLESCLYPNFGLTGLRDFEHLQGVNGKCKTLYRHIGIHILSLLLVIGSYFRNKDRSRAGLKSDGSPVDARDLFDKKFLTALIYEVFCSYYDGFVSNKFQGNFPIDLDKLSSRMIEEMGIDRHMEEIFRPADQNEMTDEEFKSFLKRRGFPFDRIKSLRKGAEEIVIYSGPHLGEFNHPISIPELIEAVGTISSLCIAGRYCSKGTT